MYVRASEPAALNIAFGLEALLFRTRQNILYLQITAKFQLLTFFENFLFNACSFNVVMMQTCVERPS